MTEYLAVHGGTIAYEVSGEGPLIVLAHGMGDSRLAYNATVPGLVAAGYRVAAVDLRGCGESSVDFDSWDRSAIAGDLICVIEHLGGPAVLVGHSIAGGAATIAAAREPGLISALVELGPFTQKQSVRLGDLRVSAYRRGTMRLVGAMLFGSVGQWHSYLDIAYPGSKPENWDERLKANGDMLREPGRIKGLRGMMRAGIKDADEALASVTAPTLIVMGTDDPDWADPAAEGRAIVDRLPAGIGTLATIEGAGHYPHDQYPERVVSLIADFAEQHSGRA